MTREQLLQRLDSAWTALQESYAGLPEERLTEPGVTDDWSVQDILAHITTWEEEALKHLPSIMAGGRPPLYTSVGGIDAFNARMTEQNRVHSLHETLQRLDETHRRLVAFVADMPEDQIARETRARRRLRLDTYSHYPIHTTAIRAWREQLTP